jgi:hypothetical protein
MFQCFKIVESSPKKGIKAGPLELSIWLHQSLPIPFVPGLPPQHMQLGTETYPGYPRIPVSSKTNQWQFWNMYAMQLSL